MNSKVSIDKAGRVVLPKSLRDKFRLSPGDDLALDSDDQSITLRPIRAQALLKKELGVWVYQGQSQAPDASIPDLIDRVREERIQELLE
ncbi:MAG TPA: AbrB/MazE/SpoVT family DNA-binding domain-containing protein [Candidatus Acidoferrum sp.]|nr:AbrB/MazE/SpoVT family DNA-binding domain-containing protein [Candidatus Acidoferrum sp.]